ncbi:hypothetical protein DFH27DRAFT_613693 [Peziza echinospora]|nr:hypothetical protein DFH27DRAFT_613693 [Peziza echinospora]
MPSTLTTRRSVILPGGAPEPAPVHPLDQVNTYTLAILNRRYPSLIHAYRPPWHGHNGTFFGRQDPVTGTWSSHRWTALRRRKKWAAQAALMKRMYELRGKRPYWTHINKTRQVSTSINLDPLSVYSHFKQLMAAPDASVIEVDPDVDEAHPLLDDILTTADVCDGLARLKNSAKGEDNLTAAKLRTIDPDEIADFFAQVQLEDHVPTIWRRSILVPLPKKGIPKTPSELRGIAILLRFT